MDAKPMMPFEQDKYGPMPAVIAALPRSPEGWPIPFFVARHPAHPLDMRLADPRKARECHQRKVCWICGQALGEVVALLGGPQSVKHATYTDAPAHPECGHYAARACPVLNGTYKRRTALGSGTIKPPGAIDDLPERVAVYCCRRYSVFLVEGTLIFRPAKCSSITWYSNGVPLEK